jgi:exosortase
MIAGSIGLRMGAARAFMETVDAWTMLVWLAGVVWLFGGWRVMYWSLPSIGFLWFMMPLPFRIERQWLSHPLQGVATRMSCWVLQSLGQPALPVGNMILLQDDRLEVEQACSGLRIFMGIVALAFAYCILVRRSWWEKLLLLASAVPIALVANCIRIVCTGLLQQCVSDEAAKTFAHDVAGWATILLAAGLFAGVLWFMGRAIREVEVVDIAGVVRRDQGEVERAIGEVDRG